MRRFERRGEEATGMIELPEALTLSKQLREAVAGRTVARVLPPTRPHRFCWFNGDAADYGARLAGASVSGARGFGIFAEINFDNGQRLCVNDGVNIRLADERELPKNYQLAVCFTDAAALVFTVAMYGGIILHGGGYDNSYYLSSLSSVSPLDPAFPDIYARRLAEAKRSLSLKAFLATEQRFPGIGNGVLQDILFDAGLHPKRKVSALSEEEADRLLRSTTGVLRRMAELGGRDTERDIYGRPGGYATIMCKSAPSAGCPRCGGEVVKESYLGGSVYYCPHCQPL